MAFDVGKQYQTQAGFTASIKWEVNQWVGGFVVQSANSAPISVRWNKNTGVSDQPGIAFNLIPEGGTVWVAVFWLGTTRRISSVVKETKQEAEQFANSGGNTLIQSFEVVL